jgi:hypothetical protein
VLRIDKGLIVEDRVRAACDFAVTPGRKRREESTPC